MPLFLCKLCGKVYNPSTVVGNKGMCRECMQNLDDMYAGIHKLLAGLGEIDKLNLTDIAEELNMKIEDVNLLYEMGYFERDIQTYTRTPSKRQELAKEFGHELDVLKEHRRVTTTYSGELYRRKNIRADY